MSDDTQKPLLPSQKEMTGKAPEGELVHANVPKGTKALADHLRSLGDSAAPFVLDDWFEQAALAIILDPGAHLALLRGAGVEL